MKTKFLKNFIVALLMIFAFTQVMFLSSCKIEEVNLESMELIEGAPTEFVIGDFKYSEYSFLVTYKDGESKTIVLTQDMLSSEDYLKTYRDGTHTLTARYLNMSCEITVTAKRFTFPSDITLQDSTVTYDGEAHGLEVIGALPEGTTITFPDGNNYIDAGQYEVNAVLVNSLYVTASVSGSLTIERAVYDMSNISFAGAEYVYDGTPKSLSVQGNTDKNLEITYSIGKAEINSMVDANDVPYTVVAHFDAGGNYLPIDDMTAELKIKKAVYNMDSVVFANKSYTYDGKYKSVKIENLNQLPKGVTVQYSNNEQKTVGKYTAVASFIGDQNNYEPIPNKTATLTISKGKVNLSDVKLDNESFEYNTSPHFVNYTGSLPSGVTFSRYEYYAVDNAGKETKVDAIIDVGTYIVKAIFLYNDKINYEDIDPLCCSVEITKADITNAVFEDLAIEYDGFSHSIYVSNLPDGVNVTYTNNAQKEVGNYVVGATFTFEPGSVADKNYNELSPMTANMSITKATMGSNFDDVTLEYSGETYKYIVEDYNGVDGKYLAKRIVIMCGTEKLGEMFEYVPQNVSIYYSTKNLASEDGTSFEATDPSEQLLYIYYYTESEDDADECFDHYNIDTNNAINVKIDGEQKQIYLLSKKTLVFKVTKKVYVPSYLNQLTDYDGSEKQILINITNDENLYTNIDLENATITFTNNKQTEVGIYTGSVVIALSSDASKYYTVSEKYDFVYAIRGEDGQQMVYNPDVEDTIFEDYVLTKEEYRLNENIDVPKGINVEFIYATTIVKPGSYAVKISVSFENDNDTSVISYGDAAEFFYRLPSTYTVNADNTYSKVVTYTINHISYTPSFETVYESEGEGVAIVPEAINLPTWISVTYYDGDKEVKLYKDEDSDYIISKPDTYHLTAKLTIVEKSMSDYYVVDENGYDFDITINKGHYSNYIIVGEKVKYDGKLHTIAIKEGTLPTGITYTTSLGEGRSEVGTYKDVIIYFGGQNDYYELPDNVKLNMVIENNTVSLGQLQAYVKTSGNKNVKQFASFKDDILGSYIDLTGADLVWAIDYYKNNIIYSSEYDNRHGSSELDNDFIFTESTADDEYAICTFTINLRKGYVFDSSSSSSYSGNLTVCVSQTKKVGIGSLTDLSDYNQIHISQGTTLEELIYSKAPVALNGSYEITYWKADYYFALGEYPAEYTDAHAVINSDRSNDFVFAINTWGERYCRVHYTIKVLGDYCFYKDGQSYQEYSGVFECLVDQNVTKVDDYFIKNAINNGDFNAERYYSLTNYLNKLIDLNYVNYSSTLYDANGDKINPNNDGKILLDTNAENSKIDLTISLKNNESSFNNTTDRQYVLTKANVILDNPHVVEVANTLSLLRTKSLEDRLVIEQYVQPGEKQMKSIPLFSDLLANTYYKFTMSYNDGEKMIGINQTDIHISKTTNPGETVKVTWVYSAKDGSCILDPETGERLGLYTFDVYGYIIPVDILDTTSLSEYGMETHTVAQYSDIKDSIGEYLDQFESLSRGYLSYKWSISYYNETEKLDIGNPVLDSTSELKFAFSEVTSGSQYVMLNLTLILRTEEDKNKTGVIFDTIEKEYTIAIRYEVSPRTLFTEPKLTTLENETYIVSEKTTLQSLINTFALNSNLVLNKWTVNFGENNSRNGNAGSVYLFNDVTTYSVTLEYTVANGTCLEVNGEYYETYSITINVKSIPVITSVLNIKNIVKKNGSINLGNISAYLNYDSEGFYVVDYLNKMFNNTSALNSLVEYKVDGGELTTLEANTQFTSLGAHTYTFIINVIESDDDAVYVIKDGNGETLAINDGSASPTSISVYFNATVVELQELDLTAKSGDDKYSFDEAWATYSLMNGFAPMTYAKYGVLSGCTILSMSITNEQSQTTTELKEKDWTNAKFFGTVSTGKYTINFTLKAEAGFKFSDGELTKSFEFTGKLISSNNNNSVDTWSQNELTSYEVLQKYIKYRNCLIGATWSSNIVVYSDETLTMSYKHCKYEGTTLKYSGTNWVTTNQEIADSGILQNSPDIPSNYYVFEINYRISTSSSCYSADGSCWCTGDYEGKVYLLRVTEKPATMEGKNLDWYEWGYVRPNSTMEYLMQKLSDKSFTYLTLAVLNYSPDINNLSTTAFKSFDKNYIYNEYVITQITFVPNFDPTKSFNSWLSYNYLRLQRKVSQIRYYYSWGWVLAIY